MADVAPLLPTDPRRISRYLLAGRVQDGFLARSPDGGQVLVTLLSGDRAADSAARDRFVAEARAARRVPPFCVARILDAGVESGRPFLVSEFAPGPTLAEIVHREGPLPPDIVHAVAVGAATGLAAIHQAGLVHGRFGPDRLVLSPEGPRVIDFSITPPYGAATPAADMLSWAGAVVVAAEGAPPSGPAVPGTAPGARGPDALPAPLASLILACLAPDPAARPTARAVLTDLLGGDAIPAGLLAAGKSHASAAAGPALTAGPATARDAPRGESAGRRPAAPARSRPVRLGIWAGVGAICVLAGAAAVHSLGRPHRPAGAGSSQHPSSHAPRSVPAAFAGRWSGPVHQRNPDLTVTVQIDLRANASGGTIAYPDLGCSGRLAVTGQQQAKLTVRQTIDAGRRNCVDGIITLARAPGGRLTFTFLRPGGPTPTGLLERSRG